MVLQEGRAASAVWSRSTSAVSVINRKVGPTGRIWLILLLVVVLSAIAVPQFATRENLTNVLRQSSLLGLVAIGQSIVMIGGGIDLSVAATLAMAEVMACVLIYNPARILPVAILVVCVGALIGLVNGLIVALRRADPFIVTLGMALVIKGAVYIWTSGYMVGNLPPAFTEIGKGSVASIPIVGIFFLVMALIVWVVLSRTTFGRRLYATGGGYAAARLSGVSVKAVKLVAFVACGALAALAGVLWAGYIGHAEISAGQGYELDSIAAVVIGGIAFSGGRGSVLGTVAGVLLLQVIFNVAVIMGLGFPGMQMAKGVIILGAAALYIRLSRQ